MRLKSVFINGYKNLKDFSLSFEGGNFLDVFVGRNGSGKSNFFEVLVDIFRHLDDFDPDDFSLGYKYKIVFEIEGEDTAIEWRDEKLFINDRERRTLGKTAFPDNILIYYSGHNETIKSLILKCEESFAKRIVKAGVGETRRFIGVGPEYKELLLSTILLQPDSCKARQYVCERLQIEASSSKFTLTLKRPPFARNVEVDPGVPDTLLWGAKGIVRDFLDALLECIEGGFSSASLYGPEKDIFTIPISRALFLKKFEGVSSQELFRSFDNLRSAGMFGQISNPIRLKHGSVADISYFSDGQFQSVYIYAVSELFKDRNCITLLDEPDSFLHPEWQFDFFKQVDEISSSAARSNHVLINTHNATTLANYENRDVRMFCFNEDNKVVARRVGKRYAIDQLSKNMIKYSEDEKILSILRTINIERRPIFFTEGSTDPDILKTAWAKLYAEPMPFIPIYAFSCVYLRPLLQDERILGELNNNPVFGLFDFDEAFNEWNSLMHKWGALETDPYKGLSTGDDAKKQYAFLLPVPTVPAIEALVIKDKAAGTHFAHKSRMGIEHLFYADTKTHPYFENEAQPGGFDLLVFKEKKKTKFAKEIVPTLDAACFEVFRPMFEFVKSKCPAA